MISTVFFIFILTMVVIYLVIINRNFFFKDKIK